MKALLLNNEVVDVHETGFPVAKPLVWIDIPEGLFVQAYEWRYRNG